MIAERPKTHTRILLHVLLLGHSGHGSEDTEGQWRGGKQIELREWEELRKGYDPSNEPCNDPTLLWQSLLHGITLFPPAPSPPFPPARPPQRESDRAREWEILRARGRDSESAGAHT